MGKKGKSKETATNTNDDEKPVIPNPVTNSTSQSPSKKSQVGSFNDAQTASNGADTVHMNGDGASHDNENQEDENELPVVVVNKWSLHELKMACDDALKQVRDSPDVPKVCDINVK